MKGKPSISNKNPIEKSEKKKGNEYIDAFNYFEGANIRNRDAFAELLEYTIKNRRKP